ncbi:MAG: hypothetical protein DWQ47_04710 [Acidobacteria bacterium]|nr:MAG: hypothetical protein DWQ32_08260 [Acidobacteriota bacterium]REK01687.1 MAG: hypothetical protein DWQ38_04695 [Acidobacteriota bacterium]REK14643.1 MAG: hypothetical protein DWQ43_13950 [Acidobacteriota bacterium]REK45358.1 MAG: hypothetical protein DWQ47_04710 [Acidobacteriota bacterium]
MSKHKDNKRDSILKLILPESEVQEIAEQLHDLHGKLDLLLEYIAIRQKDAADVLGVHTQTITNRAKNGRLSPLQRDGSRLNYFSLSEIAGLKKRRKD